MRCLFSAGCSVTSSAPIGWRIRPAQGGTRSSLKFTYSGAIQVSGMQQQETNSAKFGTPRWSAPPEVRAVRKYDIPSNISRCKLSRPPVNKRGDAVRSTTPSGRNCKCDGRRWETRQKLLPIHRKRATPKYDFLDVVETLKNRVRCIRPVSLFDRLKYG
jgi:hypothetical protein